EGATARMVTILRESESPYRSTMGLAPLAAVANQVKRLPPEFLTPDGHGISDAFRRYAQPLLGAPLPAYPRLARLRLPPRLPPDPRIEKPSVQFAEPEPGEG